MGLSNVPMLLSRGALLVKCRGAAFVTAALPSVKSSSAKSVITSARTCISVPVQV